MQTNLSVPSTNLPKNAQVAVIVGVQLNTEKDHLNDELDELESLLQTLSIRCVGRVVQRRHKLVSKSLLGSGKVEEIKQLAHEQGAAIVVFDRELTAMQARNLEEMTGLQVFDRTGIILQIFSMHARSAQAKTQVEIARLEYQLPRLTGAWTHFQRQAGGGVNMRGMGEKQIEIDRRLARSRISRLQKELEQIRQEKKEQSKSRQGELKVALVGYTNSGKTSLMNMLTKTQFLAKDALFATLDASVRVIDPRTRPKILLSDTVGFIRNLPHSLVESFKSTLDHVLDADLLLHVVDVSHPSYEAQIETTWDVLNSIGASKIPSLIVFNKADRVADPFLRKVLRRAYHQSTVVSAHNPNDALGLREHIYGFFEDTMIEARLKVDHTNQDALSTIYQSCHIISSDYESSDDILFDVRGTKSTISKLSPYVVEGSH